jgi:hypothetical protein
MAQKQIVNQAKDLIERVAWTFIEVEISLGLLDWLAGGFNINLWHQLIASLGAAVVATAKVLLAQNVGKHNDGAAIPGGVASP